MHIYAIHLAFCPARILQAGLERYEETAKAECKHVIIDQHYPVHREENRKQLERIAADYGAVFIDSGKDLGLHHGFNNATSKLHLEDEDLFLVYDPDSYPIETGWDDAFIDVMLSDSSLAYLALTSPATFPTPNLTWRDEVIAGCKVAFPSGPAQINVACWRWSFIKAAGGLKEYSEYYGHLETAMWKEMRSQGLWMGYLRDYKEDFRLTSMHDREYEDYKKAHAHSRHWRGDFASFLAAGCPPAPQS